MNSHTLLPGSAALLAIALPCQVAEQDHLADNVFKQPQWRELGPVTSGGRIVDLAVHPQKPQVFWAAAASGGLWKTTNGGISWTAQFQDEYSISIGDIAVAESAPDTLWVGSGEGNNQRSSYWGDGVYKSIDGGATFENMGLDATDHIGRIAIHPQNADVVFVAALGALYRANEDRGLYRTTDGGESWERVLYRGPNVGFVDVVFDPTDPTTLFAASYERRRRAWHLTEGGEGSRIFRSKDGGDTWSELAGGLPDGVLGRIGLDVFQRDGQTVYATIENLNPVGTPRTVIEPPIGEESRGVERIAEAEAEAEATAEVLADPVARDDFLFGEDEAQDRERRGRPRTIGGEVYRSDDGGETWTKTNGDTGIGGSPGYYYGQIRVDPNDADTVYVLSVTVYRSTDGGKTWTPRRGSRDNFARGLHVDHHALWIDPRDGQHLMLGNDGGFAVTWDGGANWDHLTHLPILQFYAVAVDEREPYNIYAGAQDNGTWAFPVQGASSAGIDWLAPERVNGGDGFQIAIDRSDPDVVYSESQFGGMMRANRRTGERAGIKPQAEKGMQPLRFNWNTPLLLSPHAPHTVYTGSQHVHRSRDRGDHWQTISPDLTSNDGAKLAGDVPHCTITTIAESPKRQGLLWVGTDDGRVWRSRDDGHRWQDLSDRFPEAVRQLWVSRVEASPHDADCAFVSFTGYREDVRTPFVFRTDDAGETWKAIAHDLPQEPVNVVRQPPRRPSVLLVGTEMGVYTSVDDGAHWLPLGHGLPRVAVHDLLVHPREAHVVLGTHGRGVWVMDAALLEALDQELLANAFAALPPSDGVSLPRPRNRGYAGAREWRADNPFVEPTFRYLLATDTDTKVVLEVLDATGEVLWTKDGETTAGYHEVPWRSERRRGPPGAGGA
ncbi:MAG: hypothetical protein KDE27_02460, partial [Planctomycetes bacterium]|nr:hypothetical protein [Planctomycetota bacterium]